MPPRVRVRVPYTYHALKQVLKQEMEATCQQIRRDVGDALQAVSRLKGYARWLYIGSLQEDSNIVDHNDATGKE